MGARAQLGSLDDPLEPIRRWLLCPPPPGFLTGAPRSQPVLPAVTLERTLLCQSNSYQQPMDLKFYKGSIFCATNSKAR